MGSSAPSNGLGSAAEIYASPSGSSRISRKAPYAPSRASRRLAPRHLRRRRLRRRQPSPNPPKPRPPVPASASTRRHRQGRPAGRRLRSIRQWRLAGADGDPGRPQQDRLLPDRRPARRAAQHRHHRGAARTNPAPGTDGRRIADYHAAYLDRATIEQRGIAPLQPHLQRIQAIANRRDSSAALGASMRADVDPLNATSFGTENLFGVFVAQGLQEPNRNLATCSRAGSACRTANITSPRRLR